MAKADNGIITFDPLGNVQATIRSVPEDQRTAFIQTADENGLTALHWAASDGRSDIAQMLINELPKDQRVAFIKTLTHDGRNALNMLVGHCFWTDIVSVLINALPPEDREDFVQKTDPTVGGRTPLYQAAGYSGRSVNLLIKTLPEGKRTRYINIPDAAGRTALDEAVTLESWDNAGLLLAYGAQSGLLSEEKKKQAKEYVLQKRDEQGAILANPKATPEALRKARQWLRMFPPNGGALDWKKADEDRQEEQALQRAKHEAVLRDPKAPKEKKEEAKTQLASLNWQAPAERGFNYFQTRLVELLSLENQKPTETKEQKALEQQKRDYLQHIQAVLELT